MTAMATLQVQAGIATRQVQAGVATTQIQTGVATIRSPPRAHHPLTPRIPHPASLIPRPALQVLETATHRVTVSLPEGARVGAKVTVVSETPAAKEVVPLLPVPTGAPIMTAVAILQVQAGMATLQAQAGVATTQIQTGEATIRSLPRAHHPLTPRIPHPASLIPRPALQVLETATHKVTVSLPEGARVGAQVTAVAEAPAMREMVPVWAGASVITGVATLQVQAGVSILQVQAGVATLQFQAGVSTLRPPPQET